MDVTTEGRNYMPHSYSDDLQCVFCDAPLHLAGPCIDEETCGQDPFKDTNSPKEGTEMNHTRMLVAYHAGTKTTFALSDLVLLVDYMQLTETERQQLDEGSLPINVLYEKSIRLDNWRASEFFDHMLNGDAA